MYSALKSPLNYAKFKVKSFNRQAQLTKTWVEDHAPILLTLKDKLSVDRPFEGTRIGVCLPGTWEALTYCSVLEAGGATVLYCPLFCAPEVGLELLRSHGIKLVDIRDADKCVRQSDFVHDTAAFLGKRLVKRKNSVKGIVEQTASGVHIYEKMESQRSLDKPVLNLDSSYVKRKYENQMATGLGLIEALLKLHIFLPEKQVVVLGFGSIGLGCASYLRDIRCEVAVYDVDLGKRKKALSAGFESGELNDLLPKADIVVNATGSPNPVLKAQEMKNLKPGVILANMGGVGWDQEYLQSRPRQKVGAGILKVALDSDRAIYEMAGGSLVNFALASGTDTETMDVVFSLGVLGMEHLVKNCETLPKGLQSIPEEIQKKHLQLVTKNSPRKIV